jgi:transcriptional regulator with XRE-family HTH domain
MTVKRLIQVAPKAHVVLAPDAKARLKSLGLLLRAARTRRRESRAAFGARMLMGETTLKRMEAGDPSVSLGYYLAAADELGVEMLSNKLAAAEALPEEMARSRGRQRADEWFP